MSTTIEPPIAQPADGPRDSQDSNGTISSVADSHRSFPGNAYAPASSTDPTPPSSGSQRQDAFANQQAQPVTNGDHVSSVSQSASQQRPSSQKHPSTTSSSSIGSGGSPTHGSKRTASGAVKSPSGMNLASLQNGRKIAHSRTTSTQSRRDSISELTAQLQFRLSRAMQKVRAQQSPQFAPPMATTSPTQNGSNAFHPPQRLAHTTAPPSKALSHIIDGSGPHSANNAWSPQQHHRNGQSESYERGQPVPPRSAPSLAPAPNFAPSSSHGRANGTINSMSRPPHLHTITPNTSQPNTNALSPRRAQTPTQQEEDAAAETLAFMASPANSGRYPRDRDGYPTNSATSPYRGYTRKMPSSSSEDDYYRRPGGAEGREMDQRQAKRRSMGAGLGLGALKSERDVDRMLDRMAAEQRDESECEGGMSYAQEFRRARMPQVRHGVDSVRRS